MNLSGIGSQPSGSVRDLPHFQLACWRGLHLNAAVVVLLGCLAGHAVTGCSDSNGLIRDPECPATFCRLYGLCSYLPACSQCPEDRYCQPGSAEECRQTTSCAFMGSCGFEDGRCVPTSTAHCDQAKACVGGCTYIDLGTGSGTCAGTGSLCAQACAWDGLCSEEDDECVATSDEDCRRSFYCQIEGECTQANGRCVAGSNSDCAASDVCTDSGRCTLSESQQACTAVSVDDCEAAVLCQSGGAIQIVDIEGPRGAAIAVQTCDCEQPSVFSKMPEPCTTIDTSARITSLDAPRETSSLRQPIRGQAEGASDVIVLVDGIMTGVTAIDADDGSFCIDVPLQADSQTSFEIVPRTASGCLGQSRSATITHTTAMTDAEEPTNVARGKPVQVSDVATDANADAIVDGDPLTWAEIAFIPDATGDFAPVTVDLQGEYTISKLVVQWNLDAVTSQASWFTLLVTDEATPTAPSSDDLSAWQVVANREYAPGDPGARGTQTIPILPGSARHVALLLYRDSTDALGEKFELAELQVLGVPASARSSAPETCP